MEDRRKPSAGEVDPTRRFIELWRFMFLSSGLNFFRFVGFLGLLSVSVLVWRIDEGPPQERLIQREKVHRVRVS